MKTFEFSVIASGLDPRDENFETRFYDAGCDDATISFQKGHIIVDFAREAETIEDAIISAVLAVRAIGATVDRVEPDSLVSLSEIAARSQLTRAAITQYAKGRRGRNFPTPVARVTSESPLYDWASVAHWLVENSKLASDEAVVARAVSRANTALLSDGLDFEKCLRHHVSTREDARSPIPDRGHAKVR